MTSISDAALERLRRVADLPDLSGTRYEAIELLGRGGMGSVYLAHDRDLDRPVAIKVVRDLETDERAAERLLAEARIVARLEHPGIVPVHDAGRLADGRVFYAMKRVEGTRLDELVRSGLALDETLRLFERICEPVAFGHAHGVVHRDLKPENVMIGAFGEVLVMDWGLARALDAGPGGAGFAGTPGYAAPEQREGIADPRSDVYALGAILVFLLTGAPPAPTDPAPLGRNRDGRPIPRRLASICLKAMAPDPAERYSDVVALAADVRRFVAGTAVLAHRESAFERLGRVVHRHRTPIVLIGAYLAMRALLLAFGR